MEIITEKSTQLTVLLDKSGLQKETIMMLKEKFQPFFDQSEEWLKRAKELVITDISQVKEMNDARVGRMALKNLRVPADNMRKLLKKDALLYNSVIQDIYNTWECPVVEAEAHLLKQENFKKVQEEKMKEQLRVERTEKLLPYVTDTNLFSLGEMSEEAFEQLYGGSKLQFEKRIEDEKKAELAKIEQERRDDLHHTRKESILHLWNFTEPELKESHLGELSDENWKNIVTSLNQEKKDADDKIEAEKEKQRIENVRLKAIADKATADKLKADKEAKKVKDIADEKLKEEQKKANDLKVKLDKIEADRKVQLDKDAADLKAKELAEKKAKGASDKVKLKKAIDEIPLIIIYSELKSEESQKVASEISDKFTAFKKWSLTKIETL